MDNLRLERLDAQHIERYESWFERAATSILFKQSKHGSFGEEIQAWAGSLDDEVVAVAILSTDQSSHGNIDIAVRRSERRQGIGEAMMTQVLALPPVKSLLKVQALVEPDNTAGQKILRNHDFVQIGSSPEGLLLFERH